MAVLKVGEVTVARVEELLGPGFKPEFMFPDWDPEVLVQHRDWLVSTHYDEQSRRLVGSLHTWVVRTGRHTVLIDTCVGNHKSRPGMGSWDQLQQPFLERLRDAGVVPEAVDMVLCTHLHSDHVGWNTQLKNGRWVPTFPHAKYLFARTEYEHYAAENARSPGANAGSFDDSVLPVVAAGQAQLIDDDHQIDDCLLVRPAHGHTPGSVTIEVTSRGAEGIFTGDILHHPMQVYRPEWNSRFCDDAEQARATRRRVLEHCVERRALLMPAHFAAPHAVRISRTGSGFAVDAFSGSHVASRPGEG